MSTKLTRDGFVIVNFGYQHDWIKEYLKTLRGIILDVSLRVFPEVASL